MLVSQVMTSEMIVASPNDTLRAAAQKMEQHDLGVLPIYEQEQLIGMVSHRDIHIRAIARGLSLESTRINQLLGTEARYLFDDQTTEYAEIYMKEFQMRRLPVINRENHLLGIVALADVKLVNSRATTEEPYTEFLQAA